MTDTVMRQELPVARPTSLAIHGEQKSRLELIEHRLGPHRLRTPFDPLCAVNPQRAVASEWELQNGTRTAIRFGFGAEHGAQRVIGLAGLMVGTKGMIAVDRPRP